MTSGTVSELHPSSRKLVEYCKKAQEDPARRAELRADPIGVLHSLGIPVEEEFREPVDSQMRALADMAEQKSLGGEDSLLGGLPPPTPSQLKGGKGARPLPPTNLRVVEAPESEVPPELRDKLAFQVKYWGVVLVVREAAIRYLKGGGQITAAVLALLGPIPIVGWITAFFAAFLAINLAEIEMQDRGNGVYIAATWAHILLCGVGLLVPIITPIK